jgi:hypothetical protein
LLVVKKQGKKRLLFLRILDAGTGLVKREIRSPFQKPVFRAIVVSLRDADGDGVLDTVVLTARKGKRKLTREVPA